MDHIHPSKKVQGVQDLDCKDPYKRFMQAFEVVGMYQLIKVRIQ